MTQMKAVRFASPATDKKGSEHMRNEGGTHSVSEDKDAPARRRESDSSSTTSSTTSEESSHPVAPHRHRNQASQHDPNICPISSGCSLDKDSLFSHLFSTHCYSCPPEVLLFDDEGVGMGEIQVPVDLRRHKKRRTTVLLSCNEDFLLWSVVARKKGEVFEVSSVIRRLPEEQKTSKNTSSSSRGGGGGGGETGDRRLTSRPSFKLTMFVRRNKKNASGAGASRINSSNSNIIANYINTANDQGEHLLWSSDLEDLVLGEGHDDLVEQRKALRIHYPRHADCFVPDNSVEGGEGQCFQLTIGCQLERKSAQPLWGLII